MAVSPTVSEIFSVKEWRGLETGGRGRSRSLEMAPYGFLLARHCIYIALSGTVFKLLDVEKYRDLEIWIRGHSRSFKLVPFESSGAVSYSSSIVTIAVSLTVYEIFSVKV